MRVTQSNQQQIRGLPQDAPSQVFPKAMWQICWARPAHSNPAGPPGNPAECVRRTPRPTLRVRREPRR